MNKLLTIIVPTYNMEQYLNKCIDSLLIESDMNLLEVIVVNDGSKDRSSEIAHAYETRFPETFRVIDKENGNYGSCINRALKECKGKYIKVLDADDYYDTKEFEKFVIFLKSTDADVVFTSFNKITFEGEMLKQAYIPSVLVNKTLDVNDFDIESYKFENNMSMHAICTKKKVLIDNDYHQTEGISYTDSELLFYSLLYSNTFSFCQSNVYQYCFGREEQTMSEQNIRKNKIHIAYITKKELKSINDLKINQFSSPVSSFLYKIVTSKLRTVIDWLYVRLELNIERQNLFMDIMEYVGNNPYLKDFDYSDSLRYRLCFEHNFPPKIFLSIYKVKNIFKKRSYSS